MRSVQVQFFAVSVFSCWVI